MAKKATVKKQKMPLIPLRGLVVFPYMILHFDVGRQKSVKALEEAMISNQLVFLAAQADEESEDPGFEELYKTGTIAKVKQLLKLPGDSIRVLVEGISRAKLTAFSNDDTFLMAEITEYMPQSVDVEDIETEALIRGAQEVFHNYFQLNNKFPPETIASIMSIDDPGQLADVIAANLMLKIPDKQSILEAVNVKQRLERLIYVLNKEIEILEIERNISAKVKKQIDKNQREYYLREQLKAIQEELGDREGITGEVEEYRRRIEAAGLGEEVTNKMNKELDRLLKMPPGMGESSVIRTYLDLVLDLPWNNKTQENKDLQNAQAILNEDHYGLEKVKERILEYLAVRTLSSGMKGPILCLVGPPGVGKTSIVRSIARSLNRNYVRMSLGGVRDEAEIRGHRRTYVGAMPGRIISALKQAGSKNSLILLDEIDKMANDFRGDPASAMLEVLDAEQNFAFRDHYLEVPFDLSEIMFVTTANSLDTIARPLLDRMEVISISGYTQEEKLNIATKYLLPKQCTKHGLKKSNLRMDEKTISSVISYYTRESGVRSLEREIANICRKAARIIITEDKKAVTVNENNLHKLLGPKRYLHEKAYGTDQVGVATGLAWTPVGGDTLSIEVNVMEGNGKIELTGHLGDVMKESARAAISYIRSKSDTLNLAKDFYKTADIHIHVPEGATPKDGPSAGITIATALISALTGYAINREVAMTGEITLRGRVLPIGGLKEKSLAAFRAGIKKIIIPNENKKDLEEIPANVREQIQFIPAESMETVLEHALSKKPTALAFTPTKTLQDIPQSEHIPQAIIDNTGVEIS